jgi:hypothetical protein
MLSLDKEIFVYNDLLRHIADVDPRSKYANLYLHFTTKNTENTKKCYIFNFCL